MAVRGAFLPRAVCRQFVHAFLKGDRYRNAYNLNLLPLASSSALRKTFSTTPLSASRNIGNDSKGYTTSFALFEGLWEAGRTACFVNVGSDHPSVIEAIVKAKRERPDRWPKIITCPSEITAISMADGYARVTGRPQAVIVHVDVGTQALGQGIHNASNGRVPVFIFAVSDPLNQQIPVSFFVAHGRWKVDSYTAVTQLVDYIKSDVSITSALKDSKYATRGAARVAVHEARVGEIVSIPRLEDGERLDPLKIIARGLDDSDRPRSWINCGGTGIGWSNGAVLGVKMALADLERDEDRKPSLVCQVVGDGSFMCAAPSSALWVASKYEIPVLTVVLNNGGWKAPRNSTQLVYPQGLNTTASDDEINTSFRPTPNYAALAEAAAGLNVGWENTLDDSGSWIKGLRVETVGEFREALQLANLRVAQEGKGMLIEVSM
ncbi:hypothetical protein V500_03361 [Pseudogymnoascus sp. VKM F-4518 (FW-2643)]|nr:hypothetical protein V500_03361 [Pseudogymnoascus sp. VKM F-4518 (FW-2643)]